MVIIRLIGHDPNFEKRYYAYAYVEGDLEKKPISRALVRFNLVPENAGPDAKKRTRFGYTNTKGVARASWVLHDTDQGNMIITAEGTRNGTRFGEHTGMFRHEAKEKK